MYHLTERQFVEGGLFAVVSQLLPVRDFALLHGLEFVDEFFYFAKLELGRFNFYPDCHPRSVTCLSHDFLKLFFYHIKLFHRLTYLLLYLFYRAFSVGVDSDPRAV